MGAKEPPPLIFSADGCYVEVRIRLEQRRRIATGHSDGERDFPEILESRYLLTVKGTHDTDPNKLTDIIRSVMTAMLGSKPKSMPPAIASGLIEFTWEGKASVGEGAILNGISEAISTSKIRNQKSRYRKGDQTTATSQPSTRRCPPGYFHTFNVYDGRAIWRCINCGSDFHSEQEVKRHQTE